MAEPDLSIVDGKVAGAWIKAELTGDWGSVAGVVPDRFDAYARILHPALDLDRNPVTWAAVAAKTGRTVHPLAQWESLVGAESYQGRATLWSGTAPDWGSLDKPLLVELCELLARHASEAASCLFGVWDGWADVVSDLSSAFPGWSEKKPRLRLPGREYVVLAGPLSAAAEIRDASGFGPQLIWPADRAWCFGSEIDFDSTLVGGSRQLIDEIIHAPRFEAWEIGPRDYLSYDADHVNPSGFEPGGERGSL